MGKDGKDDDCNELVDNVQPNGDFDLDGIGDQTDPFPNDGVDGNGGGSGDGNVPTKSGEGWEDGVLSDADYNDMVGGLVDGNGGGTSDDDMNDVAVRYQLSSGPHGGGGNGGDRWLEVSVDGNGSDGDLNDLQLGIDSGSGGGSGDGNVPSKSGNGSEGGDGSELSTRFSPASGPHGGGEGSGDGNVPTKSGNGTKDSSPVLYGSSGPHGGGGKGPGIVRKGVGKTLGLAKTMIMTAVLISVAGAGVDVYQTYNDAIAIDLEEHITDADFELSEDKSEISGSVGFDIPQMGTFEKSIIASVHITVLESNPTTDGDYEFEYTLGSGEHFYDFTLDDLDPVTVEKIEAGQPLDIEYSGTISVTYLGIEIPSITMDIPLTTTIVETA
mgnify:CR=1 FL=1